MPLRINQIEVTPLGTESTQIAVVEGIFTGTRANFFDDLLDTVSPKVPNNFVVSNEAGALLEYKSPILNGGSGLTIIDPNLIDSPTVQINIGDGLQINPSNQIELASDVVRHSRRIDTGNGLLGGGDLSSDLTIEVDETVVVPVTREINAGNGLVQDNNVLSADVTIDVQTQLNSGIAVGTDDVSVDILNTQEATSATGEDVFLMEKTDGTKHRITRDNLLAGLGRGSELRGTINPKTTWCVDFADEAYGAIPEWTAQVGSKAYMKVIYSNTTTGDFEYIFDSSNATRAYLVANTSNNWAFDPTVTKVTVNGAEVSAGDPIPVHELMNIEVEFLQASSITRLSERHDLTNDHWIGNIWDLDLRNPSDVQERFYPMTIDGLTDLNEPVSTTLVDEVGGQDGSINASVWKNLQYEEVSGDGLNPYLLVQTAPNFGGVSPSGYTYVVILEEAQKTNGALVALGGTATNPVVYEVFDQDQIQYVGTNDPAIFREGIQINQGSFIHLETGDAVISVHGRTGRVESENGDYTASQVTNVPNGNLAANNVQSALDEHQGDIDTLGQGIVDLDAKVDAEFMRMDRAEDVSGRKRFTNVDSIKLPVGTEAQRGTAEQGVIRFNTDTGDYEGHNGVEWTGLGGGGIPEYSVHNSGTTYNVGRGEGVLIDSTTIGDQVRVNLPLISNGLVAGDWVSIGFYGEAPYDVLIHSDEHPIMGLSEDFVFQTDYSVLTFSFVDATQGWTIVNAVGESEAPQAIRAKVEGTFPEGSKDFTIPYDIGFVDVYIEGYKLAHTEFNAGDGTTVSLNEPLLRESYVSIVSWSHIEVTDVTAQHVSYDNTESKLAANTVQGAIDEVWTGKPNDNLLINGNFKIDQRGTAIGPNSTYGHDRWLRVGGGSAVSMVGASVGVGAPVVGSAVTMSGTASASLGIGQRIESAAAEGIRERQVTLSGYVRVDSGTVPTSLIYPSRIPNSAADDWDGSEPAVLMTEVLAPDLSLAGWQKFEATVVADTSAWRGFEIRVVAQDCDATTNISFAGLKLERGSVATEFVPDDAATNLAKCQRYYQAITGTWSDNKYSSGNNHTNSQASSYLAQMRVTPSIVNTDVDWSLIGCTNGRFSASYSNYLVTVTSGVDTGRVYYAVTGTIHFEAEL